MTTIKLRKMILFWGFILFLSATACARPNPKICRTKNGKFSRPGTSCRGYYECKSYVPEEKTCAYGENFNANKGRCDWEDLYPCLEKQKDKECLRENGLFLKPGTYCKQYYRCCNGKAKMEWCPGDSLFDSSIGKCEWPDLYTCIEKPERKECPERNGKFLKPGTNCMKYYECSNGEPEVRKCAIGTLFNPSTENCEMMGKYTCIETPDRNKCLRRNGKFLKPGTNCKEYYKCSDGRLKSKKCERNMLFNPSSEKCESSKFYSCIESLSTTEKVSSTVTKFSTSSPPQKTSTDPAISKSTIQKISTSKFSISPSITEISTTFEPKEISSTSDVPASQSTISEMSTSQLTTEISTTQPTKTEISTTQPTITEISTAQPTITDISTAQPTITEILTAQPTITEISTAQPTLTEISTAQPTITEISTAQPTITEISTSQPTITEISTSQPTTTEISTKQSTITEISTLQSTTAEISTSRPASVSSTLGPTTSEISTIFPTTDPQVSSTHSTSHTISKEDKEGELTEPSAIFEKTKEVTYSPSTVEVTTSAEVNIMCPEPNGYFPHPTDKHKFVGCVDNTAHVLTCPSNLVYKHRIRRCDHE